MSQLFEHSFWNKTNTHTGDSSEWEMAVNLNLTAPMLLTQAFAAGMVENKVRLSYSNLADPLLVGI